MADLILSETKLGDKEASVMMVDAVGSILIGQPRARA